MDPGDTSLGRGGAWILPKLAWVDVVATRAAFEMKLLVEASQGRPAPMDGMQRSECCWWSKKTLLLCPMPSRLPALHAQLNPP